MYKLVSIPLRSFCVSGKRKSLSMNTTPLLDRLNVYVFNGHREAIFPFLDVRSQFMMKMVTKGNWKYYSTFSGDKMIKNTIKRQFEPQTVSMALKTLLPSWKSSEWSYARLVDPYQKYSEDCTGVRSYSMDESLEMLDLELFKDTLNGVYFILLFCFLFVRWLFKYFV